MRDEEEEAREEEGDDYGTVVEFPEYNLKYSKEYVKVRPGDD